MSDAARGSAPGDHFGRQAATYAAARPDYPDALYDWLAAEAPGRALAWDCGTGSGQAAVPLAARFACVVATDVNAAQLAHARAAARVHYVRARAEACPVRGGAADLVTVAQALHWFDAAAFAAEARRVLRPGGVVAAWTYGDPVLDDRDADGVVRRYSEGTVGPYWPAERAHVLDGYASLHFPFAPLTPPALTLARRWTADQVADYLASWSATARYVEDTGEDPVPALRARLRSALGAGATGVRWPVAVRAGRA